MNSGLVDFPPALSCLLWVRRKWPPDMKKRKGSQLVPGLQCFCYNRTGVSQPVSTLNRFPVEAVLRDQVGAILRDVCFGDRSGSGKLWGIFLGHPEEATGKFSSGATGVLLGQQKSIRRRSMAHTFGSHQPALGKLTKFRSLNAPLVVIGRLGMPLGRNPFVLLGRIP